MTLIQQLGRMAARFGPQATEVPKPTLPASRMINPTPTGDLPNMYDQELYELNRPENQGVGVPRSTDRLGPTKRNSPRLNTLPGLTPSNPNYVPKKVPNYGPLPGWTPPNPNPRLNTLPGLTPSNPNYVPKKVPHTASAPRYLGARKGSSGIGPR